jgi:hypothetical protein
MLLRLSPSSGANAAMYTTLSEAGGGLLEATAHGLAQRRYVEESVGAEDD